MKKKVVSNSELLQALIVQNNNRIRIESLEKTLAGRDETIARQQEIIERLRLVEKGLSTVNQRIDGLVMLLPKDAPTYEAAFDYRFPTQCS